MPLLIENTHLFKTALENSSLDSVCVNAIIKLTQPGGLFHISEDSKCSAMFLLYYVRVDRKNNCLKIIFEYGEFEELFIDCAIIPLTHDTAIFDAAKTTGYMLHTKNNMDKLMRINGFNVKD